MDIESMRFPVQMFLQCRLEFMSEQHCGTRLNWFGVQHEKRPVLRDPGGNTCLLALHHLPIPRKLG